MEWTKDAKSFLTANKYFILIAIIIFATFLRLFNLNKVPVSMFGDELDVGYQAFSILKTGKDYSGNSWPINFQGLFEWRTPLYLYSSVPTVALFGITPLGVRLPAAIFGILTIPVFYFLILALTKNETLGLIGSFILSISPWHIQYSRAGFEVTQMLFFLTLGMYLFLRAIKTKGSLLWLSGVCFSLMPWIYSTAKVFTPGILLLLFVIYFKEIFKLPRKSLVLAIVAIFLVGGPIAWSTFTGRATQRFNYISVFSDPTIESQIGTARAEEAYYRGEISNGLTPSIGDRLLHNKFTLIGNIVFNNLLTPFSTDFLFIDGDPNPRHSVDGMGELYRVEFIFLLFGLSYFALPFDRKTKILLVGWTFLGVIPSALTRDGGNHATRLILILLPLVFVVSFGIFTITTRFKKILGIIFIMGVSAVYLLSFISYQNVYWVHNPYQSERWWHYGWQEAIQSMKSVESKYKTVVITTADEPPWIFFAAWDQYDPVKWHEGYPFKKADLPGFGEVSYIDKYYFGSPQGKAGLYDWGKVLTPDMLFIASAKEVSVNLILEPNRLPFDLKLVKSIAYPSGEPAFYLLSGASKAPDLLTKPK